MAFHPVRLNPIFSFGSVGGPGTDINIQSPSGGYETRVDYLGADRSRWELAYNDLTAADIPPLLAFFKARRGPLYSFLFQAPNDYQATNQTVINNGATLQLAYTYADPVNPIVRTITKPAVDLQPVTLTKDGASFPEAGNWSLDSTTGIITLSSAAPDSVFTWTGWFDTVVRFDIQQFKGTEANLSAGAWDGITVLEVWGEG